MKESYQDIHKLYNYHISKTKQMSRFHQQYVTFKLRRGPTPKSAFELRMILPKLRATQNMISEIGWFRCLLQLQVSVKKIHFFWRCLHYNFFFVKCHTILDTHVKMTHVSSKCTCHHLGPNRTN